MTLRIAIRSVLNSLVGLAVGFAGAWMMLALAAQIDGSDPMFRMVAAYLTWFLLALLTVLTLRRFMPPVRQHDAPADGRPRSRRW